MYDFFIGLVVERRPLTLDQVRPLADGRIYTGRQALAVGLIDEIGGEVAAIAWLAATHGLDVGLPVIDVKIERKTGLIARIFDQIAGKSLISNALTLDGVVSLWHPELQ